MILIKLQTVTWSTNGYVVYKRLRGLQTVTLHIKIYLWGQAARELYGQ